MNFVPEYLHPLYDNEFELYGFKYSCIAQWILVQEAATKQEEFMHFFKMEKKDLPIMILFTIIIYA